MKSGTNTLVRGSGANPGAKARSLAGFGIALILLPILLGTLACLPAPIGDPEKAKIDPKMTGVWFGKVDKAAGILILEPFDKRCYLVTWLDLELKQADGEDDNDSPPLKLEDIGSDRIESTQSIVAKGWLTEIAGQPFMCWEPKHSLSKERGMKPELWYGWKVQFDGKDNLSLSLIKPDFKAIKEIGEDDISSERLEAVIGKNVADPELCDDPIVFQRVARENYGKISELLPTDN